MALAIGLMMSFLRILAQARDSTFHGQREKDKTQTNQFFITHVPTPWLDNKHAIFGEVIDEKDQTVVNSIVQGDNIKSITIDGDYSKLAEQNKDTLDKWNEALDKRGK